jgi:hypothetical protein
MGKGTIITLVITALFLGVVTYIIVKQVNRIQTEGGQTGRQSQDYQAQLDACSNNWLCVTQGLIGSVGGAASNFFSPIPKA